LPIATNTVIGAAKMMACVPKMKPIDTTANSSTAGGITFHCAEQTNGCDRVSRGSSYRDDKALTLPRRALEATPQC
jgi:hypothetical protein